MKKTRPRISRCLWRGLRRRCPHCGRGKLFESWFTLRSACGACGLLFEKRPGDTWAFWLIGDRLFIALMLLIIVLGLRSRDAFQAAILFAGVIVPLVVTMPHRLGVCVALDYLSRVWFGQDGEIPEKS